MSLVKKAILEQEKELEAERTMQKKKLIAIEKQLVKTKKTSLLLDSESEDDGDSVLPGKSKAGTSLSSAKTMKKNMYSECQIPSRRFKSAAREQDGKMPLSDADEGCCSTNNACKI